MRYPPTWTDQPYRGECGDWRGPGTIVSNSDFVFRHQFVADGCTNGWAFAGAPVSLVAVDLQPAVEGVFVKAGPSTALPIELTLGRPLPAPAPSPGTRVREYELPVHLRSGVSYEVLVWIGPRATPAEVAVAQSIVRSIRHS